MKLKSYFSGTVEAAMERARRELGEDALLVNARPSTPETRMLGAFEVVFGVPDGAREAVAAVPVHGAAQPGSAASLPKSARNSALSATVNADGAQERAQEKLMQEVADVKRQLERLGQSLRHPRLHPAVDAPESALYGRLVDAELDPVLAQRAAQGTPLEDLFEVDATLGRHGVRSGARDRAVVALIGPPGAGKTTTLVKLAARYGLTSRRPALILSIDVCRIAAADQLRTFASILGMGCEVVETPAALAQAIEEFKNKDYIFIDTPGYASAEMEEAEELAALFSAHAEIDTHLVLMASMKQQDLARTVDRFQIFSPHKLIFTRMDETQSFGPLVNESVRRSLPVSFLSAGQNIPDDLEPATKRRLAECVTGPASRSAGAAA